MLSAKAAPVTVFEGRVSMGLGKRVFEEGYDMIGRDGDVIGMEARKDMNGGCTFSFIQTMAFELQHRGTGVRDYVFAAETGGLVYL